MLFASKELGIIKNIIEVIWSIDKWRRKERLKTKKIKNNERSNQKLLIGYYQKKLIRKIKKEKKEWEKRIKN